MGGLKLLAVHPGADWSTVDVYNGIVPALKRQGVELIEYNLAGRIATHADYLEYAWHKAGEPAEMPTASDAVYLAGAGILERALRHDVDWVYIVSGMFVALEWLRLLKKAGLKVALHFSESPYDDERQAKWAEFADVVWTNDRYSAEKYGWHYVAPAYDQNKHFTGPIDPSLPCHDVVFVGSGFEERAMFLSLVDWSGIDFGLYGNWEGLEDDHILKQYLRADVIDNTVAAQLYRNAKIGLNLYRQNKGWASDSGIITRADSLNPRAYELAACGVFQLSEWRPEIGEMFGDSLPTFSSAKQLENHIRHYLANPSLRLGLAKRQNETIQGHTFDSRARQIIKDLAYHGCPPKLREYHERGLIYLEHVSAEGKVTPIPSTISGTFKTGNNKEATK